MSFILDALRKSEHERQRQAGPGIAELPVARPPARLPVALMVIGALLAVNLAVLLYFLLKDDAPEVLREPVVASEAPVQRPAAGSPPPPIAAAVPAPVQRELRPLVQEVAAESAAPPLSQAPPPAPDPSLLPVAPAPVAARPATARPAVPRASPPASEEFLPRLDTLPAQVTAGLPALNLDLHIYATDPAQRAVFINGRRYREGDALAEGVEVQAITTEGAVLRYRGERFLLPRP